MAADIKKVSRKAVSGGIDGSIAVVVFPFALIGAKRVLGELPEGFDLALQYLVAGACSAVIVAAKRAYQNWRKHK
jgi:hypothetical protein